MSLRVAWVLIGVSLIGSLAFFGVYRRDEALSREAAVRAQYFPLDLPGPHVFRITKTLSRRILSEKFPRTDRFTDAYFSRLALTPSSNQPRLSARASRSEKCSTIRLALATSSNSKEEELQESPEGVRLKASGLLLVPPISLARPVSFALTFGLTRGGEGFFGWPLLEVVGLTENENELFVEIIGNATDGRPTLGKPDADRQVLFNVMREETVRFFQSEGEELTLGGSTVKTVKLEYAGQFTRKNQFHQIAGAIWLAPKLGVVKESRQVVFKIYPRDVLDPATDTFRKSTRDVVLYEAGVVKLLARPITEERG